VSEQDRDLAQMDEGDAARHHRAQTLMQEAIAEVSADARDGELPDIVARLESALAARGIGPQPPRWLEAVAMDAQQGRLYVEDPQLGSDQVVEKITDERQA
jgi:hypothetical protein